MVTAAGWVRAIRQLLDGTACTRGPDPDPETGEYPDGAPFGVIGPAGQHPAIRIRVRFAGHSELLMEETSDVLHYRTALQAHGDDERYVCLFRFDDQAANPVVLEAAACWLPDPPEREHVSLAALETEIAGPDSGSVPFGFRQA